MILLATDSPAHECAAALGRACAVSITSMTLVRLWAWSGGPQIWTEVPIFYPCGT
jgi:hypothetical protein